MNKILVILSVLVVRSRNYRLSVLVEKNPYCASLIATMWLIFVYFFDNNGVLCPRLHSYTASDYKKGQFIVSFGLSVDLFAARKYKVQGASFKSN